MDPNEIKILVVDDQRDNLTTVTAVLSDALPGCTLLTATDGPRGIALARAHDPDAILLDIVMPDMDGFEVCRRLKAEARLRDIPVIFLTALGTDRETRVKALEAGAEAFLTKPPDEQELVAQLRAMVQLKAAHRRRRLEREELATLVAERTRDLELEIAERRRVEAELRSTQMFLDGIINAVADPLFVKDDQRRFVLVNDALCAIVGRSREALLGEDGDDMFPPEQVEVFDAMDRHVLTTGEINTNEESLSNLSNDEVQTIVTRKSRHIDPSGNRYLVGVIRDITAHRRAEARYRTLFREMLDAFALHELVCDAAGRPTDYRFLDVNPAFERMTGLRKSDILGKTVLAVLPNTEPHWIETYGRVALTGEPAHFESYSQVFDKHFEVTAFQTADRQFACIFSDITDRRQMEIQLAQADRLASMGVLAAGVAHEINNPLSYVLYNLVPCIKEGLRMLVRRDLP